MSEENQCLVIYSETIDYHGNDLDAKYVLKHRSDDEYLVYAKVSNPNKDYRGIEENFVLHAQGFDFDVSEEKIAKVVSEELYKIMSKESVRFFLIEDTHDFASESYDKKTVILAKDGECASDMAYYISRYSQDKDKFIVAFPTEDKYDFISFINGETAHDIGDSPYADIKYSGYFSFCDIANLNSKHNSSSVKLQYLEMIFKEKNESRQ